MTEHGRGNVAIEFFSEPVPGWHIRRNWGELACVRSLPDALRRYLADLDF
jgi:hypothetical protein